MSCVYFIMSAPRHDKIGRQGGSGPRPRIALAIKDKINALRLFYHISAVNQSFFGSHIFSIGPPQSGEQLRKRPRPVPPC